MNDDDNRERWWGHLLEALPDVFDLCSFLGEVVVFLFSALLEFLGGL